MTIRALRPEAQSRDRQSMIGAQKYLNVECVGPAPALMRGLRRKEAQIQALMERAEPKNCRPGIFRINSPR